MTTTTQPTADDADEDAFPTLEQLRGHNAPDWLVSPQGEAGHLSRTNARFVRAAAHPDRGYVAMIEENLRLRKALCTTIRACYEEVHVREVYSDALNDYGISTSPLVRSEADAKEGGAA